ncbi:SubName: Full=Uncharacterized protein {ECO:0000313/EMBL:CCA73642.1} [Serendipita indica DSM 11827]|nr:SubName: Full=Uncharacterized protein {ECO:0000313/EMBL:CCA73642.1} [Serendipita indica DSM 11827]
MRVAIFAILLALSGLLASASPLPSPVIPQVYHQNSMQNHQANAEWHDQQATYHGGRAQRYQNKLNQAQHSDDHHKIERYKAKYDVHNAMHEFHATHRNEEQAKANYHAQALAQLSSRSIDELD